MTGRRNGRETGPERWQRIESLPALPDPDARPRYVVARVVPSSRVNIRAGDPQLDEDPRDVIRRAWAEEGLRRRDAIAAGIVALLIVITLGVVVAILAPMPPGYVP